MPKSDIKMLNLENKWLTLRHNFSLCMYEREF